MSLSAEKELPSAPPGGEKNEVTTNGGYQSLDFKTKKFWQIWDFRILTSNDMNVRNPNIFVNMAQSLDFLFQIGITKSQSFNAVTAWLQYINCAIPNRFQVISESRFWFQERFSGIMDSRLEVRVTLFLCSKSAKWFASHWELLTEQNLEQKLIAQWE